MPILLADLQSTLGKSRLGEGAAEAASSLSAFAPAETTGWTEATGEAPDKTADEPAADEQADFGGGDTKTTVSGGLAGHAPAPEGLKASTDIDSHEAGSFGAFGGVMPLSGSIVGSDGDDIIHGTAHDDIILDHGSGSAWVFDNDEMFGHGGNDILIASLGDDTLHGGDGTDSLYGGDGADTLNGDDGFDFLYGGAGGDTLNAGAGTGAVMYGEDGDDIINGGAGNDWVRGGNHDDTITGGGGRDRLWGDGYESAFQAQGNDTILGGDGDDDIYGMGGDDFLDGGDGNDVICGEEGNDTMLGGQGNDILFDGRIDPVVGYKARSGYAFMDGGDGIDQLIGATGANIMTGGAGADIFAAALPDPSGQGWNVHDDLVFNTVTDYSAAQGDQVVGNATVQVGANVHVTDGDGTLLFVLIGVDLTTETVDLIPM